MSERYTNLFALPKKLYLNNAPVLIAAGALLKDTETGKVLAQLKIQNIQNNTIKAATVKIVPLDTVGKPLGNEVEHLYLDLNAARDMDFGKKVPLLLPDPATRSFSVSIASVSTSCINGERKLDYFCTITDNVTLPDDTTANTRFSGSVDAASYTSNTTIQIATMSVESWTAASLSQPTRYPVDPTMKQAYQETANSLMNMFMNHFSNAIQKNTDTTMVDLGFSKELEESLTNK